MAFRIPTSGELIARSTETFKRFPLAMLSSIVGTLIAVYLIEVEPHEMEGIYLILAKILLSSSLAIFVFSAIRLAGESLGSYGHQVLTLLALLGLVLYYVVLPDTSRDFSMTMVPFRHFFLILLFAVALLWAPFVRSDLDNGDYWEYSKQILFAFVITFLFTVIMVLGVNGALFAMEKLFDLDLDGKRYFQVDVIILGVFSVGYFLSQIPLSPLESRQSPKPPRVEKFFTKWVLTPLSGLYFVILYSYSAKVLLTMNWPKGILAWLIVVFSVVAILTYLFWTHFSQEQHRRWRRWIWLAILLQTVMLFVAIWIRITEYSWTESRYMVFVLGIWLAGVSLYFLLMKNPKIKWIFVSISLLIAVTQFGPINAYTVSKNAQMHRLEGMLVELKKHADAVKAPLKLRYEISDVLRYLDRRYGSDSLATLFPRLSKEFDELRAKREKKHKEREEQIRKGHALSPALIEADGQPYSLPEYITKKLGFTFVNHWEYRHNKEGPKRNTSFNTKGNHGYMGSGNKMIEVRGYDYMTPISMNGYRYVKGEKRTLQLEERKFTEQGLALAYTKNHHLIIRKNDINITFEIEDLMKNLVAKYGRGQKEIEEQEMTIRKQNKGLRVKLKLNSISEEFLDANKSIGFSGLLFIKEL